MNRIFLIFFSLSAGCASEAPGTEPADSAHSAGADWAHSAGADWAHSAGADWAHSATHASPEGQLTILADGDLAGADFLTEIHWSSEGEGGSLSLDFGEDRADDDLGISPGAVGQAPAPELVEAALEAWLDAPVPADAEDAAFYELRGSLLQALTTWSSGQAPPPFSVEFTCAECHDGGGGKIVCTGCVVIIVM